MKHRAAFLALGLIVIACGESEDDETWDDVNCKNKKQPSVKIVTSTAATDGTSLVLTGTASHPDKLTVRNIYVQGIETTKQSTNFASWTVTVPQGAWQPVRDGDKVTLEVDVVDPCERYSTTDDARLPDELINLPADEEAGDGGGGGT